MISGNFRDFLENDADLESIDSEANPYHALIKQYVSFNYQNNQQPDEWDLSILGRLRTDILDAKLENEFTNSTLEYLDFLEALPHHLHWQVEIDPAIYQESLQFTLSTLQKAILQTTADPTNKAAMEDVFTDLLRFHETKEPNKENKIEIDYYLNDEQFVLDVTHEVENNLSIDAFTIMQNENLINHWKTSVAKLTDNPALINFIQLCSNQHITNLTCNVLQEQNKQLLSSNPNNFIGESIGLVSVTVPSNNIKYKIDRTKRNAQNKLIYKSSSEIIIKETGNVHSPYSLELITKIECYDPQLKYIFPMVYNLGFLKQQLDLIELPQELNGLNHEQKSALKLAIQDAGNRVADKLSCHDFEMFFSGLKASLIDEATEIEETKDNEGEDSQEKIIQKFKNRASVYATAYLQSVIRCIINSNSNYIVDRKDEENNEIKLQLIDYYLNDITDQEGKETFKKCAKKENKMALPLNNFNNFLALTMMKSFGSAYDPDQDNDLDETSSSFISKLFKALSDGSKQEVKEKREEYINSVNLESEIDPSTFVFQVIYKPIFEAYLISSILENIKNATEHQKNAAREIAKNLTNLLASDGSNFLFNVKGNNGINYAKSIASDVSDDIKSSPDIANDIRNISLKNSTKLILKRDIVKQDYLIENPFYRDFVLKSIKLNGNAEKDKNNITLEQANTRIIEKVAKGVASSQPNEQNNFTEEGIRSLILSYYMKKPIKYNSQALHDEIVQQQIENFTKSSFFNNRLRNSFEPNPAQVALLAEMATFDELHKQRCQQMGINDPKAEERAIQSNAVGMRTYFTNLNMPVTLLPQDMFNRYLRETEYLLRQELAPEIQNNNAAYLEQRQIIAKQKLAIINQYRYFNKDNKISKLSVGLLNMLKDRNFLFTDFSDKWFGEVKEQLLMIKSGRFDLEDHLVELKELEKQGKNFAKDQWFPSNLILKNKLQDLSKFINAIENAYAETQGELYDYQMSRGDDGADLDFLNKKNKFDRKITTLAEEKNSSEYEYKFAIVPEQTNDTCCVPLLIPNKQDQANLATLKRFSLFNKSQDQIHINNAADLEKETIELGKEKKLASIESRSHI